MIHYIYALVDPRDNRVRYIGKTINPKQRFNNHLYMKNINLKKDEWIEDLRANNLLPEMKIIDKCKHWDWQYRERYWIDKYRKDDPDLLNIADGGTLPGTKNQFRECLICRAGRRGHDNICEYCDSNKRKTKYTKRDLEIMKEIYEYYV